MAEPGNTSPGDDNEIQKEKQDRIHADERVGMDRSDMDEAIAHEHDQKDTPGDESRYEGAVDEALPEDSR